MADSVNFVMLIAVSIGSLALGVLSAYGVLRAAFACMRPQRKPLLNGEPGEATVLATDF